MNRVLALVVNAVVNAVVTDVIIGSAVNFPAAVDVTDITPRPGPGWSFDGKVFAPPEVAAQPVPTSWFIRESEFMNRWTLEELALFYGLKQTDPLVAAADALVTRLGGVQNDSERTQQLLGYLVQKKVLTAARVPVLLAAPAGG